jgi:endonuclease III
MIDPDNITNFNRTESELEEVLIFWICVAGKTAATIKRCVENVLLEAEKSYKTPPLTRKPFNLIRKIGKHDLASVLRRNGIGCHTAKAGAIWELATSGLDLKTCSYEDLRAIKGIGRKTSKCFLIHSRRDARAAGLDTHILKGLRRRGYTEAPLSTPSSDREYRYWENIVLDLVQIEGKSVAEWDLYEWKAGKNEKNIRN